MCCMFFFFQAEDGIRYLVRSRGLGDVYKRQVPEGFYNSSTNSLNAKDTVRAFLRSASSPYNIIDLSLIHI